MFVICGVVIVGVINLKANRNNWLEDSPWDSEQHLMDELVKEWDRMKSIGIKRGMLTKQPDGSIIGRGNPEMWFDEVEKTIKCRT